MLSSEIVKLENQNRMLKEALDELKEKIETNNVLKPRSCQYCKHYFQHYIKVENGFRPVHFGHCVNGAPISKGRKREPKPDNTCPYFEFGTYDTRNYV